MAQQLEETLAKLLVPDNNTIQQVSATQKFPFLCFQCFQPTGKKCTECPRAFHM